MTDEMIISRGLECLRDSLLSDLARGVVPAPWAYLFSLEKHCLRILLTDDTGPGESDFPGPRSLCRALRRAGHPCHWVWWEDDGSYYRFSLPNRSYRVFHSEAGPPAAVDLGDTPAFRSPVEVAVRPVDFVRLMEHFDTGIVPRLPEAFSDYCFFLEKEVMARKILRAAAVARKGACPFNASDSRP